MRRYRRIFRQEAQVLSLDGRRIWVRAIGHAVRDRTASVVRVRGALQEIAPPNYSHGTLLRHTVSMGGAMGSGEAFVTLDRDGRLSYLNEEALRLVGGTQEALLGRRFWNSFQKTVRWLEVRLPRSGAGWRSTFVTSVRVGKPSSI